MRLGYDKVNYYARLFGLGEKAGLNIEEETPGDLPEGPPANGGMGMMTSFGEGITLTPLQLACDDIRDRERRNALLAAIPSLPGGS